MYNALSFYTFIALLIFFLGIEIYRAKNYLKGIVVEFCPSSLGVEEFILTRMKVKLSNGTVVEAEASQCTMCMGNINIGDKVYLSRSNDKYLINLPLSLKKKSGIQNTCSR